MFKIYDGRQLFYQWDLNRKLLVGDSSITQVHFSNRNRDTALVLEVYELDGRRVVDVPNILLQEDCLIDAYAYLDDHTRRRCAFKVARRPKPEEYEYTETEVLTFSKMMERAEEAANAADESAGKAADSEQAAKTSEGNAAASATAAETAKTEAVEAAEDAKASAGNAATSEQAAKTSEEAAAASANRAEEIVNNAAWIEAKIDEKGHLIVTQSDNFNGATFTLNENGHLEVAYI